MTRFFVSVELLEVRNSRQTCNRRRATQSARRGHRRQLRSAQVWRAFCHASAHCRTPVSARCLSRRSSRQVLGVERPRRRHTREIFSLVEMVSIDEAYLDLSGTERLHGPPLAATDKLLRAITRTTDFPAPAVLQLRGSSPRSLPTKPSRAACCGSRRAAKHAFLPVIRPQNSRHRRSDRTRIARAQHRNSGTTGGAAAGKT